MAVPERQLASAATPNLLPRRLFKGEFVLADGAKQRTTTSSARVD
jgi:hypothetical protein